MAQQRPLKKVDIVVATPVLNVTYSQLTLPITLGYWRDEGYDVDLHTADGSLQAVQQLVGENAGFAAASANAIVLANIKSNQPVRVAMVFQTSDFALVVGESSATRQSRTRDDRSRQPPLAHRSLERPAASERWIRARRTVCRDGFGATVVQAIKSGRAGFDYWAPRSRA